MHFLIWAEIIERQMPGCDWFSLSIKIIHDHYFLPYLSKSSNLSTIIYVALVIVKAFQISKLK